MPQLLTDGLERSCVTNSREDFLTNRPNENSPSVPDQSDPMVQKSLFSRIEILGSPTQSERPDGGVDENNQRDSALRRAL